jgi:hypothetical protein
MFQAQYNNEADHYAVLRQARDAVRLAQLTLMHARQGLAESVRDELRQLERLGTEAAQVLNQPRPPQFP